MGVEVGVGVGVGVGGWQGTRVLRLPGAAKLSGNVGVDMVSSYTESLLSRSTPHASMKTHFRAAAAVRRRRVAWRAPQREVCACVHAAHEWPCGCACVLSYVRVRAGCERRREGARRRAVTRENRIAGRRCRHLRAGSGATKLVQMRHGYAGEPSPTADVGGGEPSPTPRGRGEPSPGADKAAASRALERDVQRTACRLKRLRLAPLVL